MEYRILGPLELVGDDGQPIEITAPKQRDLLVCLLLRANEAVATDRLVDALWGGTPPSSAPKVLQMYVSQLRRVLGRDTLETRSPGYLLHVAPESLDSARFERLLADGREALEEGNPQLAATLLRRGLALWRGPALADAAYADFATAEAARLDELRLVCLEERIDADLAQGRHKETLAELSALVVEHPLRERLQAHLMLALYRSGRQAEALTAYREARRVLHDELGLEPGEELRGLEREILEQHPRLAAPTRSEPSASRLPAPLTPLVGRTRELRQLQELLTRDDVRLVVLTGAGGSGKTRLALEAARTTEPAFANGAVFVELAPVRDEGLVLSTIARALRVQEGPGTDQLETLAAAIRSHELLLVIDNAEHLREGTPVYVQLLSRCPRLTILVTSRSVLHLSGEHVLPVLPLAEDDAVELFRQRCRDIDPSFELTTDNEPAVRDVCRRVDCLPLALELAAGRVRTMTPDALLERLAMRLTILTGGPRDLPARQQTLRETIAWSVDLLDRQERDVFARLAVFPGGATLEAAERVCGADLDTLGVLVDDHLVIRQDGFGEPRFGMLETVREYALELLGEDRERIELALADYFTHLADDLQRTSQAEADWFPAVERLDPEIDNVRVGLAAAERSGDSELQLRIAGGVWRYWLVRGFPGEGLAWIERALAIDGPPTAVRAGALYGGAGLAWTRGDTKRARELAERAIPVSIESGSTWNELSAHTVLGLVAVAEGEFENARAHLRRAIVLKEQLGVDPVVEKLNLGVVELDAGDTDAAKELFEEVLDWHRQRDNPAGIGFALLNLGLVHIQEGAQEEARVAFEEGRARFEQVGFRQQVAHGLQGLAACAARDGDFEAAARLLGAARRELDAMGIPWDGFAGDLTAATEADARAALGDERYDALSAGILSHP